MAFSNLHTHSDYSIHDGFAKIPDLVKRAKELNYGALALTDHGTVSGLIPFYKECKKQQIKPILGCEMYFTNEITLNDSPTYHMLIIAKNNTGYKNLMKLNSYAHEHFYKKPRIDYDALKNYHDGLICTTACIAGILSIEDEDVAIGTMKKLHALFNDDFYIEIQPHNFKEQKEYNNKLIEISDEYNQKLIVTLDSHYVNESDVEMHKLWLNLAPDSQYYESNDYYLINENEIYEKLNYLEKNYLTSALLNVEEIVKKCNVEIDFTQHYYPVFCDDPESYVRKRCNEGYVEKSIAKNIHKKEHIERIKDEIDMLKKVGYLNYMCIIDDMIQWCNKNGIRTGLGRGSVCGSDVAYLMGITKIDPIRYKLVFERFCNPERTSSADIDTDVQTSRRPEVINYIKNKYGDVYQVRTFGFIKEKSAIRRACQSIKMKPTETNEFCKKYSLIEDLPECRVKEIANSFYGHIINFSTHASAVIVSPVDINNFTSIEHQMINKVPTMVVAYDFHDCEDMGLLKLDILGLQHLDDIDTVIKQTGIDYYNIPNTDKETCDMINSGDTCGVFQSERGSFTNILLRMKVSSENDFILTNALCRPGTLDSGTTEEFIKRRRVHTNYSFFTKELESELKDTLGLILYQEQVMTCSKILCGYSLGQADNVRRIIGRKIKEEMQPCIDDMIEKSKALGIPQEVVQSFTNVVEKSAYYLFNKSHSTAYGVTAWRSAYLKCHYPEYYLSSILNSNSKDNEKIAMYVNNAIKRKIKINKPELGIPKCIANEGEITIGTNCIKGAGTIEPPIDKNNIESIVMQYPSNKIKALIKGGALDYLNYSQGNKFYLLANIENYKIYLKTRERYRNSIIDLESKIKNGNTSKSVIKRMESYKNKLSSLTYKKNDVPIMDNATMEIEVLGFTFDNPFKDYDTHLVNNKDVIAIFVSKFTKKKDRHGHDMAFVKDTYGNEYVMFYRSFKILEENECYLIGLDNRKGKITNIINSCRKLERIKP